MSIIETFMRYVSTHKEYMGSKSMTKNTIVVNAFAGPGAGKTVSALTLAAELAKKGYVTEYVSEYAKELVWDNNLDLLSGEPDLQLAVLQEQVHRIDRVYGSVDFIVCDSPIMLNPLYLAVPDSQYNDLTFDLFSQYNNFCYFVERDPQRFEQQGRIHDLNESIKKDVEIQKLLYSYKIYFGIYNHNTITKILDNIIKYQNRINKALLQSEHQRESDESGTSSASTAENPTPKKHEQKSQHIVQTNKLNKLVENTVSKVLSSGEEFYSFLKLMSRFKEFSANNLMLIYGQNSAATQLKSFDEWKAENKHIKKGVTSIKIRRKADNNNDGFTVINLFDLSQLRSEDIPEMPERETLSERHQYKRFFKLMANGFAPAAKIAGESNRAEVSLDELHGEDALYNTQEKVIYIREDLPIVVQLNLICRESLLSYIAGRDKSYDRDKYIAECSCAALVVCERFGVDTSYFLPELDEFCKGFSVDDMKSVKRFIDSIKSKANTVTEIINKNSRKIEDKVSERPVEITQ